MNSLAVRPSWAEERRMRQLLNGGSQEVLTVQCEDGRLSVTVDQHILQSLSVPVAAVTLQDPTCQAQSNGSHFLLVFPVISCGTEGLPMGQPRRVQYKNMMLLWRDKPQTILALNETERKSKSPLSIHLRCLASLPSLSGPASDDIEEVNTPHSVLAPWVPGDPGPSSGLNHLPIPRHRSGPVLTLRLFVTENYEERRSGPCVITAGHRVYVEISAKGPITGVLEVKSCVVSPLSDPKKSPFWSVISEGCSSDPSLTLSAKTNDEDDEDDEEADGDSEEEKEEDKKETEGMKKDRVYHRDGDVSLRHPGENRKTGKNSKSMGAEEETKPLRFSLILRPILNDSMQFLHCSLRMCVSDSTRGEPMKETVKNKCQGGVRIPPLVSNSPKHQCEIRNLSRPMVVTQSISSLAPKVPRPPAGQRTKRLSVSPLSSPDPNNSSSVLQTGAVLGIIFAAFIMGVILMGGLWCIYNYTASSPTLLGGESHLTDESHGSNSTWNPLPQSNQSSSSV